MTKDELAYWLSVTESSRFKWTEDTIFRLNGRGSFYYTGGEDGIYIKIGKDGLLEAGTYEGAIPHIGEAMFEPAATKRYASYSEAFAVAMEAGGKQFLIDMFSAGAPEAPEQKPIIRALITNPKDMADMFLSLDRLRNSDYARKWHDFPTTKEEMQAVFKEIRIDDTKRGEYYINDYESPIPGLAEHLQAGADIDELNYLAIKLNGMDESDLEKFCAAMEYSVFRDGLTDIINTAKNLDCFDLQPAFSETEYGEFLADMECDRYGLQVKALDESSNPADCELAAYIRLLEKYFDTEAYVRDVVKKENGRFTKYGYVTKEKALEEIYTGVNDIPPEYRVSTPPEREPQERPSALDKLAAAKDAVARADAEKPPADRVAGKAPEAEL